MRRFDIIRIIGLVCICLYTSFARAARNQDDADMFISCELSEKSVYERQPVTATITLYTTNPDIAFADMTKAPELNKGDFSSLQKVNAGIRPSEQVIKGKRYFCFPIESFLFTVSDKGTYSIDGGSYVIGVSQQVVVNDPFWGPVTTSEIERIELPVRKADFKVRSLPDPPAGFDFSGAVGDFSIETVIPKGDIFINEEAIAVVIIKGYGVIADSVMPEYRDAFKTGVKLKSVSESRSDMMRNGKPVSELRLECTFIPLERENASIGPVSFGFFNPNTGKYESVSSSPVSVEVKSTTVKRESISI